MFDLHDNRKRGGARLIGLLALVLLPMGTALGAEPYRLSIADKVLVKVVQWKAATAEFEELTAIGGDYLVGPDGNTAFPFVGPTPSAGMTTAELAQSLGAGLQQALGLPTPPDVTVQVSAYGPIYVSGDVASPGEYSFSPGLTVIKALSLAGGQRLEADRSGGRYQRELLTTTGTLDVLRDEHLRLRVRLARLDAELAGSETVTLPEDLAGSDAAKALLSAEEAIMLSRQRQMAAQITSFDDEVALLNRQIETFEQKRDSMQRQLELAQEQLARINQLSDDGLALASRVTALETSVADLEGRLLDVDTATLQARQDIAAAERERSELGDVRISELTLERQTVDGQIAAAALKIANNEALFQETAVTSGVEMAAERAGQAEPVYAYSIIRDGAEMPADMNTPVMAGDVIVARLNLITGEAL